MTKLDN